MFHRVIIIKEAANRKSSANNQPLKYSVINNCVTKPNKTLEIQYTRSKFVQPTRSNIAK